MRAIGFQFANAAINIYDRSQEIAKSLIMKSASGDSPNEQRKPLPNHPAARLLRRPNPIRSSSSFFYQVACHMVLTGGFAIWEVRNPMGMPVELWPIPRAFMQYQRASEQHPLGIWRIQPPRGVTGMTGPLSGGFMLDARDLIMDGLPHPLFPGEWHSMMSACAQIVDIMEKGDLATWSALVNSPKPGMILSVDSETTEEQMDQLEEHVSSKKSGAHNAGKILIARGVDPKPLMGSMAELDSVAMREQNQSFGLGIHGVPRLAIGAVDGATYSGNAAAINAWIELSVQCLLNIFSSAVTHRFQRYWGEDFEAEFSAKRFDDPTLDRQKSDSLKDAFSKGLVTGNEWRACEKLPPLPELDKITPPQQPAAPGMPGQSAPGAPQDGEFDLSPDVPDLGDEQPQDDSEFDLSPSLLPDSIKSRMNGVPSANGVH